MTTGRDDRWADSHVKAYFPHRERLICNHITRDEAVNCPMYRSNRAEQRYPLHGPNHFHLHFDVASPQESAPEKVAVSAVDPAGDPGASTRQSSTAPRPGPRPVSMPTPLVDAPDNSDEPESDYLKFRGKCRELAEQAAAADSTLRLVRGHYLCPLWGMQPHWWCVRGDGTIVDPTVRQFPTKGAGAEYVEFDGAVECEYCNKRVPELEAYAVGHHVYCSYECYGHDIGF